jgi:uncharacterized membrane protein
MNFIPDPLHPAVVHFPIVLIVLGTLASVTAVFWRKGYVPAFAAALLVLGALGAWAAVATGESDGGLVENTSAGVEQLLEAHENWAKRTLTAAVVAAVIAVGAALLFRFPRAARGPRAAHGVAVAAALAAGVASWTVYETGHRGGALVYQHGAGVNTARTAIDAETSTVPQTSGRMKEEDRD